MSVNSSSAAAAEAAKRAAAEAAKKAAAEAAKKAAAEAAKRAAQQQAKKPKPAEANEPPEPEKKQEQDGLSGLLGDMVNKVKDTATQVIDAATPDPIKPAEAKSQLKRLQADFAQVERPAQLRKLAGEASALRGRIEATPGADAAAMQKEASALADKSTRAAEGLDTLEQLESDMKSKGPERAAAISTLLAKPEGIRAAIGQLEGIQGTPLAKSLKDQTREVAKQATPENLAKSLEKNPDLTQYPSDAVENMARLRGLGDPKLNAALDQSANALLDQEGGLSLEDVQANPAYGQLLAGTQDPALQARVKEAAQGWAEASIDGHLDGAEGEDETRDAMEAFKTEMTDLARETGLGTAIAEGAQAGVEAKTGDIEDHASEGGGILGDIAGAIGDVLGDVGDFVGDLAGDVLDAAGDITNAVGGFALDKLGDAGGFLVENGGDVASFGIRTAGQGTGGVLDAIGLDGAADDVRAGTAKAADVTETVTEYAGTAMKDGLSGLADKILEAPLGPEKPEYKDQIDGVTGAITNRLGKGDAVFLKGDAGLEVGVGLFAGASVKGGASLSRDEDGQINLSLQVSGSVRGGVKAEVGASGGVGPASAGATASAEAALSAGAGGTVNLKFDPENPDDVARLKNLIEPTPEKLTALAGNPLAIAGSGEDLAAAMEHNLDSHELNVSAGADANAKAKGNLGPLGAEIGVEADAIASATKKYNADGSTETTLSLKAGAGASVAATLGGIGPQANARAQAISAVTVTRDKNGEITGIEGEHDANLKAGAGVKAGTTSAGETDEATGKDIGEKSGKFGLNSGTTAVVRRALTGPALERAKEQIEAGKNPLSAFIAETDRPGSVKESTVTTQTDSIDVGFNATIGLGAYAEINANFSIGKSHTEIEKGENGAPSLIDTRLT